jgi:inner membrane protein
MDNLCHTLTGAAFGETGLKRRTRFGNATLMIAANLPDLDVLAFATSVPAVALRRGWTHGTLAQLLLPVALTGVMLLIARLRPARGDTPPVNTGWLLVLSYIGVLSHVALDLLNSYGVRLLMPFSPRWFYGDAVFIIDPWIWLALGIGVWLGRRDRPVLARHALTLTLMYVVAMVLNGRVARGIVLEEWRMTRGGAPAGLMVGPTPVTPFRREIIADAGIHYERGTMTWWPVGVSFDANVVPKNDTDPRVARARNAPNIRAFLVWSRFPFWTFEETADGTRVTVSDMRFIGRGEPFTQSVLVP